MIRIAICDDETVFLQSISKTLTRQFQQLNFKNQIDIFVSGEELLNLHKKHPYDVIFLDICMPTMNGFEVAKGIRQWNGEALLIFVTSQDALVYSSLDYRPFQFVRKNHPLSFTKELQSVTEKIIRHFHDMELLELDLGLGERRTLCYRDIAYLKSSLHYIEYHLVNGEKLRVRQSISEAAEQLQSYGFIKTHRQYIVNMRKVVMVNVNTDQLRLCTTEVLPMGKTYREVTLAAYRQQMRNMP